MRVVTYIAEGRPRLGALSPRDGRDMVVDLNRADPRLPEDMIGFLRGGETTLSIAREALPAAAEGTAYELGSVELGPVVPNPSKIICIGLNYRDHAEETGQAVPTTPTVFAKYPNALVGHGAPVVLPRATDQVDYEVELAFVIGARARHVGAAEAMEYVAGYTVMNDVSARDYQMATSQWTIGKSFDTFAPLGPALVTRDELPDPHALAIRLSIGDEVLQDSSTANLVFGVPALIEYLSGVMTLEPGDVIATGTPGGVGFIRKPPRYLRAGETMRAEVEGVGVLESPVVGED